MSNAKVYPVKKAVFWKQILMGILWIAVGVFGIFDNVVCKILEILFLVAAIIASAKSIKMICIGNDADEMAENDYAKARAYAGDALETLLCIVSIVFALEPQFLQNLDINWLSFIAKLGLFLAGVYNLLGGLIFLKLEAE